ncbi:hypothetical protein C2G38_2051626 [Gigaspora rosea]|uniref:Uncharacterized protein n=1 Tax=Gigaspora rosea TaxID=44941 RepID=A0A397TVU6_9GLOM|nr:hypothetical protein C2G38_2051626 [Gigaspora rosea]
MVNVKYYRAYVFYSEDNKSWACQNMIELQYFKKIWITPKNLIMFNDTINEITLWNIHLSAKACILMEWSHILHHIEVSVDEELLAVCTEDKISKETNLYIFSTETGINLSSYTTKSKIDRFHLIASQKGERLLCRYINNSGKYTFNLMDPYNLKNPINANLNTNMFTQFGSAAIASYYMMITGDSTPISLWVSNENIMIMLLMLMIIKDREMLYMLPHQRRKENWFPFVIFYECHITKLREHIMGIQDKWTGYKKPYISKALNEILHLPEEPLIYNRIERFEDKIEKKIEDLSVLKLDIKELKESFEDMKTNK